MKPPKPRYPWRPKGAKRMTIAIGLMASDGLIIAADTQETIPGIWKNDTGKITAIVSAAKDEQDRKGFRGLLLTGAGDGHYLDAVMSELRDEFGADKKRSDDEIEKAIRTRLIDFHGRHVTALGLPAGERPDFDLLLAMQMPEGESRLFVSRHNLFKRVGLFAAVGSGSALATTLLSRIYQKIPDTRTAILMASYVMYHVKDCIDGCGRHTDIFGLRPHGHGSPLFVVNRLDSKQLEDAVGHYVILSDGHAIRRVMGMTEPDEKRAQRNVEKALGDIVAGVRLDMIKRDGAKPKVGRLNRKSPKRGQKDLPPSPA